MGCVFGHNWSWPRRRAGRDVQICPNCGTERASKVRFDGPRYRRTQEAVPSFVAMPRQIEAGTGGDEAGGFTSLAA